MFIEFAIRGDKSISISCERPDLSNQIKNVPAYFLDFPKVVRLVRDIFYQINHYRDFILEKLEYLISRKEKGMYCYVAICD